MNFIFYNCILEGRQLWLVEPFLLASWKIPRTMPILLLTRYAVLFAICGVINDFK